MSTPLGGFSLEDARKIHKAVLGRTFSQPAQIGSQMQQVQNLLYYAVLTEDLAAASDAETGYTQAEARCLRYVQPVSNDNLNMEESDGGDGLITITNRFTSFSAVTGDVLLVIRNIAEYSPLTSVSTSQRHAKVVSCLGDGYYRIQMSTGPAFDLPGTGTTGVAEPGTGTGITGCDLCDQITGETINPSVTCGSLTQPTRASVTGSGEELFAYDPRKLSLSPNAHVIVTNMGDVVETTGTGTGTAMNSETLWIILTGNYDLVAIPDRFYECCVDTPKLVRCDNYIVEGIYCPGQEVTCTGTAI